MDNNRVNQEVQTFAEAIQKWAEEEPKREQKQLLLKWLLSRCGSRGFKGPEEVDKDAIKRTGIEDIKIKDAVMRAMAGYNPDLPTKSGLRGGPIWPKAYTPIWPKAYST